MYREDCFGFTGDFFFDIFRVKSIGLLLDVSKHRRRTCKDDYVCSGDKGKWRDNDFSSVFDIIGQKGCMKRWCPRVKRNSVFFFNKTSDVFFQRLYFGTHGPVTSPFDDPGDCDDILCIPVHFEERNFPIHFFHPFSVCFLERWYFQPMVRRCLCWLCW